MEYPFGVSIRKIDDELPYDELRFEMTMENAWTPEAKDEVTEVIEVWKEACRLGAFSGHILRSLWAKRHQSNVDLFVGVAYYMASQWSTLEFDDRRCRWSAYDFGPGEPGVVALLDMLWIVHLGFPVQAVLVS